jgi:hypothetical protein
VLAFTDTDQSQKRAPGAPTFILSTRDILKLVMDEGFDGLVINAAGPWAGVPREDVEKILNGAW